MSGHKNSTPAPAPAPPTTEQINDNIEAGKSPEDTPGSNWSIGADNNDITEYDTRAKGLEVPNKNSATVILENPGDASFHSMLLAFVAANPVLGSAQSNQWQDIASQMLDAINTFKQDIMTLDDKGDWKGKTHDAAMANLNQSLAEPQALITGIGNLGALLDAFTDTIFQTRWYFLKWGGPYYDDLTKWPHHADEVRQGFDSFAQKVITTVYQPNIQQIADENPAFSSGQQVSVDDGTGGPDNSPPKDPPPPPDPNLSATTRDAQGDPPPGPNDPNNSDFPDLSKQLSNIGGNLDGLGSGLSNLLGGPNGGASSDGFDPSQLPGGPNAALNALPPPGASSDGFDPSQLPGGPGADPNALAPPGGSSDGFDPSQLPGGPGASPPDLSQLNGLSPPDPNGAGSLGNLPGLPNGATGSPSDGSSGLSGLGNLGSSLSGLGSPGGGASGGGPAGAANSASGLGSQLSSALGPATDALKQATGAGQPPGGGAPGGMPGGLPGMDPKGLDAAHGAGPGGGARAGGGGGAGIGGRGLDPSRPGGVPVAGLGKGPALASAAGSRLGAPGQGAGSGSGAPPGGGGGGGQRGPTGKDHKANKTLRRKRNGELVIGEPDAVVAVIGDDGPDTEAAEPSMPHTPPAAAPPAPRSAPAASARRPGPEQLRAELEL